MKGEQVVATDIDENGLRALAPLAHVDEISVLVALLASEEAGFITGQTYAVDGGWSI